MEISAPFLVDPTSEKHFEMKVEMGFDGEQHYFDDSVMDQEEFIITSLYELYGSWLRENNISEYQMRVRCSKKAVPGGTCYTTQTGTYSLTPYIEFENDADAMAFKLAWL